MKKSFVIPKILLVSNTAWSMYNFRLGVAHALKKEGYEIVIAAPADHTSMMIQAEGFEFVAIPMDNKGVSISKDLKLIQQFYLQYKKIKPNLIIHYTIKPNIYGSIAAKLAGIQSIAFVTGLGSMFIKRTLITSLIEGMYRFAFTFPKRVWFLNEEDHGFFTKGKLVSQKKAEVLPGEGINTVEFCKPAIAGEANAVITFLYLGRILKDKGVYELMEAARLLKNKGLCVKFQILGFIDALNPSAISKEEVDLWVAEGLVDYLGQTSDVKPYILAADCIVLPSYREGISRTLLEAASMEKPIIASNVTGCREVVDAGISGYLCEVKNAVDLAQKIEEFLKLPVAERAKMGAAGREKVKKEFDESLIIEKYRAALNEML